MISHVNLFILNPTRTQNLRVIPGVIVDEAKGFLKNLAKTNILLFNEKQRTRVIFRKTEFDTEIFSVPLQISKGILRFFFSYLSSLVTMVNLLLGMKGKIRYNLLRADEVILTGIPAWIVGRMTKTPYVLLVAGSVQETIERRLKLGRIPCLVRWIVSKIVSIIERVVISSASHVFCVTSELYQRCQEFGARNISMSGTFVDLAAFRPTPLNQKPHTDFKILFVGRLEKEKGIFDLIQAFHRLEEPNAKLEIVGEGSSKHLLLQTIRKLNLESKVKLTGLITHDAMPSVYKDADILVLPSYTEGLPVSILEAMSSKRPTIATRVGMLPEIFQDKVHLIFITPGNIEELTKALRLLINNRTIRETLAKNGHKLVISKFGSYLDEHARIYNGIVQHIF